MIITTSCVAIIAFSLQLMVSPSKMICLQWMFLLSLCVSVSYDLYDQSCPGLNFGAKTLPGDELIGRGWRHDIQRNDIKPKDVQQCCFQKQWKGGFNLQCWCLSLYTFLRLNVILLRMLNVFLLGTLSVILLKMLNVILLKMLNVILLSVVLLNVVAPRGGKFVNFTVSEFWRCEIW
jgi:hypothetical protein